MPISHASHLTKINCSIELQHGLPLTCVLFDFCQIKVLDMLNQERVSAERKDMTYRIERRAAQGREEAELRQVLP